MTYILPLTAAIAFSTAAAKPQVRISPAPASASQPLDQLLSKRALRRAKLLIQLRLYELRDERLECVRMAILRRLPADLRPQDPLRSCLEADSSMK
jgi:hypothetical protein